MPNMTISPIQPIRGDYVTKGEFNERFEEQKEYMDEGFSKSFELTEKVDKKIDIFRSEVNKRFDGLESRFDEQKSYTKDGFDKVFKQMDSIESHLGKKIDGFDNNVGNLDKKIGSAEDNLKALREEFPKHLNTLRRWLREDMQTAFKAYSDKFRKN